LHAGRLFGNAPGDNTCEGVKASEVE
jgi:hypothetical protein